MAGNLDRCDLMKAPRTESKKIVVTGGAGFIGSNLVRCLVRRGHAVVVIDAMMEGSGAHRRNLADVESDLVGFVEADLATGTEWQEAVAGASCIYHLAAQCSHAASMAEPVQDLYSNTLGTLRLVETVRTVAPEAVVVFASTRQVYGRPTTLPVDESHRICPPDVNAVHKIAAEEYFRIYGRVYGIRGIILRLTNTYGPRMRVCDARQTFLGLWVRLTLQGSEIAVFGDGQQRRDLTYVDDVVDALMSSEELAAPTVPTYNVGGSTTKLGDLAQMLIDMAQRGQYALKPFPEERKKIDIGDFEVDDRAFRRASGWSPKVDLPEGLRRTLMFYEQEGERYW